MRTLTIRRAKARKGAKTVRSNNDYADMGEVRDHTPRRLQMDNDGDDDLPTSTSMTPTSTMTPTADIASREAPQIATVTPTSQDFASVSSSSPGSESSSYIRQQQEQQRQAELLEKYQMKNKELCEECRQLEKVASSLTSEKQALELNTTIILSCLREQIAKLQEEKETLVYKCGTLERRLAEMRNRTARLRYDYYRASSTSTSSFKST